MSFLNIFNISKIYHEYRDTPRSISNGITTVFIVNLRINQIVNNDGSYPTIPQILAVINYAIDVLIVEVRGRFGF